MFDITKHIGKPAVLEQCAEECAELAQVCLKAARKLRDENPTPMTWDEIVQKLNEEAADVTLCMNVMVGADLLSYEAIDSEYTIKEERWKTRIEEKENNDIKGE